MLELKEGMPAPDFTMPTSESKQVSLDDYQGRKVVLYFYPKDDTPGCTIEAKDFTQNIKKFQSLNCEVIGVSRDDLKSHEKFAAKHCLKFTLASDTEGDVCERYGVWKEKSMYGKKYMGIERSTFLIDEKGKLQKLWKNVKVDGHIEEVLKAIAN